MWHKDTIYIYPVPVHYIVKYAKDGIEDGRITKLEAKINGKTAFRYDKRWRVKPSTKVAKTACKILVSIFNLV